MPVSEQLYNKAKDLSTTLVPKLRKVTPNDTIMPDDYNVAISILQQYLQSVNQPFSAPRLSVAMHDNVYYTDVGALKNNAYTLWNYINSSLGDPYASDPDFQNLKSTLDSIPFLFFGAPLTDKEWNLVSDFCQKITSVILKYPPTPEISPSGVWFETIKNNIFVLLRKIFGITFSETITLTETFRASVIKSLVTSISTALSDIYQIIYRIPVALSETIDSVIDSSIIRNMVARFSEELTLAEEFSIKAIRFLSTNISTTLSDAYQFVYRIPVVITETINNVVNSSILRNIVERFEEAISLTETFTTTITKILNTSISTTLSDAYQFVYRFTASLSEAISNVVNSSLIRNILKTFSEAITLSETFVKSVTKVFNTSISNSFLDQYTLLYRGILSWSESVRNSIPSTFQAYRFSNVPHTDRAHSDRFSNSIHSDLAHGDSHSDIAFSNVLHSNYSVFYDIVGEPRIQGTPTHSDVAHSDRAHSDSHYNYAHSDYHSDVFSNTAFSNVAHSDFLNAY